MTENDRPLKDWLNDIADKCAWEGPHEYFLDYVDPETLPRPLMIRTMAFRGAWKQIESYFEDNGVDLYQEEND